MLVGEVEKKGEVLNAEGTKVFEVVDGETIRPYGTRVAAEPNGLLDCVLMNDRRSEFGRSRTEAEVAHFGRSRSRSRSRSRCFL